MINIATLISVYYNDSADLLSDALDSVIKQKLPVNINSRIYVAVDGEISNSLQMVLNCKGSSIYRIIYLEENKGLANALNELISILNDECFVFRMDSDDWSFPNRYIEQLKYFQLNPAVDILGTEIIEYDVVSGATRQIKFAKDHLDAYNKISFRTPVAHPTVCFRRRVLDVVGGYPICGTNEDIALWFKCMKLGFIFGNVPIPLLRFTIGSGFWQRRGFHKAYSEFVCYAKGIWGLNKFTWKYIFPLSRLLLRLMPTFFAKLIYRSFIRG